jgi:hypothetical protein
MGAGTSRITSRRTPGVLNNPKLPVATRVANIRSVQTPLGLAGQGNLVRPLPGVGAGAVSGTATAGAPRAQVIRTQKKPGHWHNPTGK